MTYGTIITWDSNPSSAIEELVVQKTNRGALGAVKDTEVAIAGRDGSWVFPDGRGNRTITADARIDGTPTARRAAVPELGGWLDKTGYKELVFSDEPTRYWNARLLSAPAVDEWRGKAAFQLAWSAEPYAYSTTLSSECVTATGGDDSGTFAVPDAIGAYPVIEITPLTAAMTEFTLNVNGYTLTVTGINVGAGSTLTVSSYSYTITGGSNAEAELNGAYTASPLWTLDASGEFPVLLGNATNTWALTYISASTDVQICFYWRERSY